MKLILLSATAITGFALSALASDLPTRSAPLAPTIVAAPNWSGAFIGVHGGLAQPNFRNNWNSTDYCEQYQSFFCSPGTEPVARPFSEEGDSYGSLFGVQLGYNWQVRNNVVVGVEASVSQVKFNRVDRALDPTCTGPFGDSACGAPFSSYNGDVAEFAVNSLGSIRAKLGMTFGSFMPYVTGGIGFVNATFTAETSNQDFPAKISINKFVPVVGAGIAWKANQNISINFDVHHYMVDFSRDTWDFGGGRRSGEEYTGKNSINLRSTTVGKVGVNYHW